MPAVVRLVSGEVFPTAPVKMVAAASTVSVCAPLTVLANVTFTPLPLSVVPLPSVSTPKVVFCDSVSEPFNVNPPLGAVNV